MASCSSVKVDLQETRELYCLTKAIVSFSIFRRRYHNETIVFLKNENVNIPKDTPPLNNSIKNRGLIKHLPNSQF